MRLINKLNITISAVALSVLLLIFMPILYMLMSAVSGEIDKCHGKIVETATTKGVTPEFVMLSHEQCRKLVRDDIYNTMVIIAVVATLCLVIFLAAAALIMSRVLAPLNNAVKFADDLAKGVCTGEVKSSRKDEIGALIKALNHMRMRMEHSIAKLKVTHKRELDARKSAESTNNIKSEFLANIAHELKNPLNSIIGLSSLIMKDIENNVKDPELSGKIRMVLSSSEALGELISSLLELAKLGKEEYVLDIQEINTSDFMREVIDASVYIAERKSISIENHFSAKMSETIKTDKKLLLNTLLKLIANAVRITVIGGSVEIGCDTENDSIVFWIREKNNMTGVSVTLASIYNKFLNGYDELGINQGLQGVVLLNLTIATANANLLEAKITAEVDEKDNSTFRMELPVYLQKVDGSESADIKATHMATNIIRVKRRNDNDGKQKKAKRHPDEPVNILMAEDSEANRMLVELVFQRTNYNLECVEDGVYCLEVLERKKFDLLLLDLQMPRLDGYDVLKRIRENKSLNDMPIIVLTAYLEAGDHDKILIAGADDYMLKPIDVDELLEKVRNQL